MDNSFWQSRKEYPMEKESPQQMVLESWTTTCRIMKLDHFLTPCTKINSKRMKDLNVRQETIKILEENTGSNLLNISCSNFLLDMSPEERETKAKINYCDFIRIKSFCTVKESTKLKGNLWNRRRYFQMTHVIKGQYPIIRCQYPKFIKNLSNSTPKKNK